MIRHLFNQSTVNPLLNQYYPLDSAALTNSNVSSRILLNRMVFVCIKTKMKENRLHPFAKSSTVSLCAKKKKKIPIPMVKSSDPSDGHTYKTMHNQTHSLATQMVPSHSEGKAQSPARFQISLPTKNLVKGTPSLDGMGKV